MKKFWKYLFQSAVLVILIAGSSLTVTAEELEPPKPMLSGTVDSENTLTGKVDNGNNETPGEWYAGSTPPNLLPDAPVLLFVPGLNSVAQVFFEDNDLYQTAYDAGYQTAFIQLHDAGGASADMWDNGELLAEKIVEISNHFSGKPITIIAHSKGGVDSQTALIYYGAAPYVENVITLSSPHHGSQLADLAYSSWASWLADLIGAKGDGTYAMQMGNMEDFRLQTDAHPLAYSKDYYTLGGTAWGSMFSANWYGGMYLSQYGSNDGVVTTASSNLPGGEEIAIGDWTHSTIRTGATFSEYEDYISDNGIQQLSSSRDSIDKNSPSTNHWVYGGDISAKETIRLTVEEDVQQLDLQLITATPLSSVSLINPEGKIVTPKFINEKITDGVFVGGMSNIIQIDKPHSGEWQLQINSNEKNAYLLVANYESSTNLVQVDHNKMKDNQLNYQLDVDSSIVIPNSIQTTFHITDTKNNAKIKEFTVKGQAALSQTINLSKADTVYNITIDIEGKTKAGNVFKRTIIDSVKH